MTNPTSKNAMRNGSSVRVSLGITCSVPDCKKRVRTGSYFCINHGGGLRCTHPRCKAAARDGSLHCIKHGGGRRCAANNCGKGAVGNTDLCKTHGGGRRCLHPNCGAPARSGGKVQMCQRHGGGKRCKVEGCDRVAAARSDHCTLHRKPAASPAEPQVTSEPVLLDERWAEAPWFILDGPLSEEREEPVKTG
ncbi:hypothetical protein FOZ63_010944, partial [Perkinsus olseni]